MRVHTIWLDYLYVREKNFQSQNIFKKFLSVQSSMIIKKIKEFFQKNKK